MNVVTNRSVKRPNARLALEAFRANKMFAKNATRRIQTPSGKGVGFGRCLIRPAHAHRKRPTFLYCVSLCMAVRDRGVVRGIAVPPGDLVLIRGSRCMRSRRIVTRVHTQTCAFGFGREIQGRVCSSSRKRVR